jgi:hypothetical protein
MWWFHLLARRVETLRQRCDVFERVTRAGGRMRYGERADPLLLSYSGSVVGYPSRYRICSSTCNGFTRRIYDSDGYQHVYSLKDMLETMTMDYYVDFYNLRVFG